jgi:hypothetical protein
MEALGVCLWTFFPIFFFFSERFTEEEKKNNQNSRFLSLDSNEKTHFKARELKSVHVKAVGTFLRILIHKCHINDLNVFAQVGFKAITVFGTPAAKFPVAGGTSVQFTPPVTLVRLFSLLDFLSLPLKFCICGLYLFTQGSGITDPMIAQKITELNRAKVAAAEGYLSTLFFFFFFFFSFF